MKSLLLLPVALSAFLVSQPAAVPALRAGNDWSIDPVHSSVVLKIKHANVSNFYGLFEKVSGKLSIDPAHPAGGHIEVEIAADSVHSHDAKRDAHLLGPDFFDVKQYPVIKFTSSKLTAKGADAFEVEGTLELHGKSKTVTATVHKTGEGDFMGPRVGYEAVFTIKRSDFGMEYGIAKNALSDEVQVTLAASCMQSKG
jgi:polyisoprenoid-binding protein YceI